MTIYVQGGHFDSEVDDDIDEDSFHDAWFGRIVGRYFLSEESRLQAEFAYADGEQDTDNQDMEVYSWGARYDFQWFDRFGVFVAYDGAYYDNDGSGFDTGSYYDHVIRGGLSLSFGRPTLFSIDRTGPNLDMPDFARWGASGQNID